MAKKQRFERLNAESSQGCWDPSARKQINRHSEALEQHDSDIERLTKTEGRHRRRMEGIEARLDRLEGRHSYMADLLTDLAEMLGIGYNKFKRWVPLKDQPPKPEPVVVEGIASCREYDGIDTGTLAFDGFWMLNKSVRHGDRVRLTIERIDDD